MATVTDRRLEQRQELGDGWHTEWEPAELPQEGRRGTAARIFNLDTDAGWSRMVRELNVIEKAEGSNIRWRSVTCERDY